MIENVKRYGLIAAGVVSSLAIAPTAFAAELFTIPSLDNIVASTSPTVNGSFLIFVGIGLFILGFVIGIMLLVALIRVIRRGVARVLSGAGGGRGGGRRRRR